MKKIILSLLFVLLSFSAFAQGMNGQANKLSNIPASIITGTLPTANGGTGCTGLRLVTTGATDTVQTTDCAVAWNSATSGGKTETLPTCASGNKSRLIVFKDEYGNAGTNVITLTPTAGTIEGNASAFINSNKGYAGYMCDGGSNWMRVQ